MFKSCCRAALRCELGNSELDFLLNAACFTGPFGADVYVPLVILNRLSLWLITVFAVRKCYALDFIHSRQYYEGYRFFLLLALVC